MVCNCNCTRPMFFFLVLCSVRISFISTKKSVVMVLEYEGFAYLLHENEIKKRRDKLCKNSTNKRNVAIWPRQWSIKNNKAANQKRIEIMNFHLQTAFLFHTLCSFLLHLVCCVHSALFLLFYFFLTPNRIYSFVYVGCRLYFMSGKEDFAAWNIKLAIKCFTYKHKKPPSN